MHPSSLPLLSLTLSLLASLSTTLTITSPNTTTILTPTNFTIIWSASNISPSHLSINLINADLSGGGGGYAAIATNISAADDSYTFSADTIEGLGYVSNGSGWVITLNSVAGEGNAFLGESGRFTIAGVGGGAGNATSGVGASSSASGGSGFGSTATGAGAVGSSKTSAAGTTQITGTSTSTSTASGAGSGESSSGSGSATAVTSTSSAFAATATAKIGFAAGGVLGAAALAFLV